MWKDSGKVAEASESLKLTADDLVSLGAVEKIFEENDFPETFFEDMKEQIFRFFQQKKKVPADELIEERYRRFRKF